MESKICVDCGTSFEFSANERIWYKSKNFQEPKRCKECRAKKKMEGLR